MTMNSQQLNDTVKNVIAKDNYDRVSGTTKADYKVREILKARKQQEINKQKAKVASTDKGRTDLVKAALRKRGNI